MNSINGLTTISLAARQVGISYAAMQKRIQRGRIPKIKVGHVVLIAMADVIHDAYAVETKVRRR